MADALLRDALTAGQLMFLFAAFCGWPVVPDEHPSPIYSPSRFPGRSTIAPYPAPARPRALTASRRAPFAPPSPAAPMGAVRTASSAAPAASAGTSTACSVPSNSM